MINEVHIPECLLESQDYRELNERQAFNFGARLRHCLEIASSASSASTALDADLGSIVDDVELDSMSVASTFGSVDEQISTYVIHSSWTFDCDRLKMASYVDIGIVKFLATPGIGMAEKPEDVRSWLVGWGAALSFVLRQFSAAVNISEAVSQLIVVDALIASALQFSAMMRLNITMNFSPP